MASPSLSTRTISGLAPLIVSAFLLPFLAGCPAQDRSKLFPASGRVSMNGRAIDGAAVVFIPSGGGATQQASQAETDGEGRFQIETYIGSEYETGVLPGEYVVTISKLETVVDMRKRPRNLLPGKYESPDTSDLTAVVEADGDNEFTFQLDNE